VLEPFFTTKPVGEGTGLGLSITYAIVKKHGGSLHIEDAEGGGARISFRIPLGEEARSA
jgi:two-component system sensor histidine kinase HupT/HoxJ